MNYIDIILLIPIIWAIYRGFKDGVIVQLGGLFGVLLGVWLAYEFGDNVVKMFDAKGQYIHIAGFLLVFVVVILVVWILGRVLRGLVKAVGLGVFDQIGGVALSLFKMVLICGVVILLFEMGNKRFDWVKQKTLKASILYMPIAAVSSVAFPYLTDVHDRWFNSEKGLFNDKKGEEK